MSVTDDRLYELAQLTADEHDEPVFLILDPVASPICGHVPVAPYWVLSSQVLPHERAARGVWIQPNRESPPSYLGVKSHG